MEMTIKQAWEIANDWRCPEYATREVSDAENAAACAVIRAHSGGYPVRRLTCCCCGESTMGRQWFNRDHGFGLCVACIPLCSRNTTPQEFQSCYGVRGVHFDVALPGAANE